MRGGIHCADVSVHRPFKLAQLKDWRSGSLSASACLSHVRQTLDAGIAAPKEIAAWIQERHGVAVKASLINAVKHQYGKKPTPKVAAPASTSLDAIVDDIRAVRELVERHGKDGLARLIDVL